MSAIEPGPAFRRHEINPARALFIDARAGSLLAREARHRAVTRTFGVPGDEQTLLATIVLTGAAATVVAGLIPRPFSRPSGADVGMGGAVINATLRGFAGVPAGTMPFASALIAFAVLTHSARPVVEESIRDVRAAVHGVKSAFSARYGR